MVLTKDWFRKEIDSEPNPEVRLFGERIFQKYTEAPVKGVQSTQTKFKEFDADETYKKVVTYYIDNKGYTKEQAHEVAVSVVNREKQRRGLS